MGKIRIHNMHFYTYNGVLAMERHVGQPIGIDITIDYPIERLVLHDDVRETINYAEVRGTIDTFVSTHSFQLIESLANALLTKLLISYPTVANIQLKIRKYNVPMPGIYDDIEIEVEGHPANE